MTRKLTATIGLPGSGKTTWTLKQVNTDPDTICRANRDALRIATAGRRLGKGRQEAIVTETQNALIRAAFTHGYQHVIVDDTNLRGLGKLRRLAADLGVDFVVKDFRTVPLETCIERDALRRNGEYVGEKVIREMHDECVLPWLRERAREAERQRGDVHEHGVHSAVRL